MKLQDKTLLYEQSEGMTTIYFKSTPVTQSVQHVEMYQISVPKRRKSRVIFPINCKRYNYHSLLKKATIDKIVNQVVVRISLDTAIPAGKA